MNKRERKALRHRLLRTGERYYAWYSARMDACIMPSNGKPNGHCIYLRPDGKQVKCTLISKNRKHGCRWDDIKFLGKVIGPAFGGLIKINKPMPDVLMPPMEPIDHHRATWLAHHYATTHTVGIAILTCS